MVKKIFRYSGEVKITIRLDGDNVFHCDVQQGSDGSTVNLPIEFFEEPRDSCDPKFLDDVAITAIWHARVAEPTLYLSTCYDATGDIHISRDSRTSWLS
jgi:hypothetical protein